MPAYIQIPLLIIAIIIFYFLLLLLSGWGIRKICFKIIAQLEESNAFTTGKAIKLPDERQNFFRVGTGNLRPKALNVLIAEKIVIKTGTGKYYLDKDKMADIKAREKVNTDV
jgi:hypothetical protein